MSSYNNIKPVYLHSCGKYDYSEIKKAVENIGKELVNGWDSFIPDKAKVLLKPNLLMGTDPSKAVTTHPLIVKAVTEICKEAGASKVTIGDSPALGSTRKVAGKAGLLSVAKETGAEIHDFTESVQVSTPEGFMHRNFTIAKEVIDADIIINLPKFKTHALMVITLSVKNNYGLFVGKQKMRWHLQSGRNYEYFARLLVELAYTIKPSLSIIDAVIGMEGNGPSSGTPRNLGFIAASEDMLSLDSVCTEIAGINPDKNYCLKVANEMGFKTDLKDIPLKGDPVNQFRMDDFKPASTMAVDGPPILQPFLWILRPLCTVKPFVNKDLCKGCGICMKACPPQSISLPESKAVVSIDHNKCIRCFCCQELCPEGAIHAKDPIGVKIMKALGLE